VSKVVKALFPCAARSADIADVMEAETPRTIALAETAAPVAVVPEREEPRVVWALAWPVILALLSESLVALVDMLMVARLGPTSVAAVGVGGQILNGVSVTMTAVATGTLALVARRIGASARREAEAVVGQSILTAAVLAVLVILPVIFFAESLVRAFGVDPAVVELGTTFTRLVMLSIPSSAVLFVVGSALRAAGDTRTPLALAVLVNVINVAANYLLIFGHFGFPALGVAGPGVATAIAFTTGAGTALWLLARGDLRLSLHRSDLRPDVATIRSVLRIGSPAAAEQLLMQVGFFLYLLFAVEYGTDAVAAYFIGVRILALSFLPGFGFAAAAAALVGQHLGAGRPARAASAAWLATWMSVLLMSAGGVMVFLAAEPIARLFVADQAVIAATVSFIWMLAISQPLMALDFTLGGALRGAGDTRFPLWTVVIAFYGCRLGMALVVVHGLRLSLAWLWAALIGDYVARAAMKAWRVRGGAWRAIEV
jgi:putative MATE family efflux protein